MCSTLVECSARVARAPFQSDPSSSPGLGSFCIDTHGGTAQALTHLKVFA